MTFYRFNGHNGEIVTLERLIEFNTLEDAIKDVPSQDEQSYSVSIVFEVDGKVYTGMPISLKEQVKARWTRRDGWLYPHSPNWKWGVL